MAKYLKYSYEELNRFCMDCFGKFGFDEKQSRIITDVLLLSDLYGIESHGMQRLARYHKGIEKGLIKVGAQPEVVFETPVSAVIEGNDGMGQLISHFAMEKAIEKAKTTGMAVVTVRNSNHFGIAGYYAKMACDQGLIGMAMTNSEAIMVPTYGRLAMLGSNPLAISVPADPCDFFFDASTTVVTRGKLEVYNKQSKPLPLGWALNKDGKPSSDADDVLKNITAKNGGGIMPLGGDTEQFGSHKGYGYSMICELLCSITSGGATSNHHVRKPGQSAGTCHAFIVIDPKIFGDTEEIKAHLSSFLQELRDAKRADENVPIYTHGEKEIYAREKALREGINVDISTVLEMVNICRDLDIDYKKYLGDVDLSNAKETTYKIYK